MFIINTYELLTKKVDSKQVFCDEPMKKHTSFKIGGNADFFVIAKNIEDIKWVIEVANMNNIPLNVVGNGTNLLVLDGGIRGIVLKPQLNNIEVYDEEIIAEAGALLNLVCKKALDNELSGLEFAYGIPGTIGGAIKMNAGAYGGEMKDLVIETTYITRTGEIKTITEHGFSYRKSIFSNSDEIILKTKLKLSKGNKEEIQSKMKEYMESRKKNQPLELPNAGSTFKRGDSFITAKLIDEAGLKGYRIGDAKVSLKHAGFIVNKGNATAENILDLVAYIKEQVYEKFKQNIELEIIVMGDVKE